MFLFPIGLYTYFFIEKKTKKEYQEVFDNFFEQMLLQNEYEITSISKSLEFIFMGLGLYIVGLFFYLAYYFWFQKPHRVEFFL
jgi:hypothetical protein